MDGPTTLAQPGAPPLESRALTGLRGLGALLVMSHHFYLHLGLRTHLPLLEGLLQSGFMGVDLFFVLSGFVISMVYGSWFDGSAAGGGRQVPVFLVRRIARLWPLHAALLLILIGLGALSGVPAGSVRMLGANLAMVQAWGATAAINPPAWSVSAEFLAYLAFPAMAAVVLRSRLGMLVGAMAVIVLLSSCLAFAPPLGPGRRGLLDLYQNYSVLPCLRCLAGFVTGMLAWRAGLLAPVRRWCGTGWVGPAALALFTALLLFRVDGLFGYILLPLVVLGMHYGSGPLCRVFATGPIYRLGVLSYAVYLIHYVLLEDFPLDQVPLWAAFALYVVVTLGLALLAHMAIEIPGRLAVRSIGAATLGRLLPPYRVAS